MHAYVTLLFCLHVYIYIAQTTGRGLASHRVDTLNPIRSDTVVNVAYTAAASNLVRISDMQHQTVITVCMC